MSMKQGFEMGESPINTLQDDSEFFDPEAEENRKAYIFLEIDVIKASVGPDKLTTENKAAWIKDHAAAFLFVIRENSHLLRDYAEGMAEKNEPKKAVAVREIIKLMG